ncbi:MAG: Protein-glutamine gamma-glutamyltransferase [bacterium ADurb.Bin363]|nr:MAG: Protein-glutamine gamma-glutamyltransferase [bacterium ADurb.Bin363]
MKQDISLHVSGILLLFCSMAPFAFITNEYYLIGFLAIIVLISPLIKFRYSVSRKIEYIIYLCLTIPAILKYFLEPVIEVETGYYAVLQIPGYYFIFLSIAIIYRVKYRSDLLALHFSSLIILMVSGFSTRAYYFEWFVLLHLLLASFYLRSFFGIYYKSISFSFRIRQGIVISFVLILTGVVFLASNRFVEWLEPITNNMLFPTGSSGLNYAGFLNETSLNVTGNMKLSDKVVLRLITSSQIQRLRCKVYTDYIKGSWKTSPKRKVLSSVVRENLTLPEYGKEYKGIFTAGYSLPEVPEFIDCIVKTVSYGNTVFFTPPETYMLMVNIPGVQIDQYGIFYPDPPSEKMEYALIGLAGLDKVLCPESDDTNRYLDVPSYLDTRIVSLAKDLTSSKEDAYSKCLAIEGYFHRTFQYGLDFKPSKQGDPVEEFILNKKSAHCEYFATGMILLLRSCGIPSRYVTGFLVHEYNRSTGYYVVRERDSHAWVEAYLPQGDWVTFDPTPPGGLFEQYLGENEPGIFKQIIDFVLFKWEDIKDFLSRGDFMGLLKWILESMSGAIKEIVFYPLISVPLFLVILYWLYKKRRIIKIFRKRKDEFIKDEISPVIERLHSLLSRFDNLLRKKKIKRPFNLTLYEYIEYLKEHNLPEKELKITSELINEYCNLRYGLQEIQEGDLISLENKIFKLEEIYAKYRNR